MNSVYQRLFDTTVGRFDRFIRRRYVALRYGTLTEHVTGTVGDCVPAEIEYRDSKGRVIGFWAYGYWHPDYPFQG